MEASEHTGVSGQQAEARKLFYVAVGAGQILEDQQASSYELEIRANEEEVGRLQELMEELSSWDEAQTIHFFGPVSSVSNDRLNLGYDILLNKIYSLIHELGTESTRQHIDSMGIELNQYEN
ncbi:hypothetical protein EBB07_01030 [Paenibacillaceae bacterium]|nr:hypothetical protein EBB07_01030 [Paenibacillaceae bacterium]